MKRSDIHTASIHEYHIHDKVFKSLKKASEFFGVSLSLCSMIFRGEHKPSQIIRDKLGVQDGIHIHAAAIHSFQIHNQEFDSLLEASLFFDMSTSRCSDVFRGRELPSWVMVNKLRIRHL